MSADHLTDAEIKLLASNQCPACKNFGFIGGPRGGAGQNIYCANPQCRAAFMVAPRKAIMLAQRVGTALECYYPPQVHILHHGQPLCGFAGYHWLDNGPPPQIEAVLPDEWPVGHSWVGREDFELATCPQCREKARS